MGNILKFRKLTTFAEIGIITLIVIAVGISAYFLIPNKVKNIDAKTTNVDSVKSNDVSSVDTPATILVKESVRVTTPKSKSIKVSPKKDTRVKEPIQKIKKYEGRENLNIKF